MIVLQLRTFALFNFSNVEIETFRLKEKEFTRMRLIVDKKRKDFEFLRTSKKREKEKEKKSWNAQCCRTVLALFTTIHNLKLIPRSITETYHKTAKVVVLSPDFLQS